jgi:hypothetical protein
MANEETLQANEEADFIVSSFGEYHEGEYVTKELLRAIICSSIVFKQTIPASLEYTTAQLEVVACCHS